jgi:hypothetical protein
MNTPEFVLWYINKLYIFTGTKLTIKYSRDNVSFSTFVSDIKSSLNINTVDKKQINSFLHSWYLSKQEEAKNDLLDYIKFKYKVTLGPTNWEISKMNNKIIKVNDIILDVKKQYDKEFIENVVEEWFKNEVIKTSEKIILNFD